MGRPRVAEFHARSTFEVLAPTTGKQPCTSSPEAWFSTDTHLTRAAAEACTYCPFMNPCRLEGLMGNQRGVWGGLSYNQRSHFGRARRLAEVARLRLIVPNLRSHESHEEAV